MYEILKSNEKHFIIKVKKNNSYVVKKYALINAKHLKEEIKRIKFLSTKSRLYYKYQINITNNQDGKIFNLINKNFYEMPFTKGKTFSNIISNKNYKIKDKKKLFNFLYSKLFDLSKEQTTIEKNNLQMNWMKRYELTLNEIENISFVNELLNNSLIINNIKYEAARDIMEKIFKYGKISFQPFNKSHANFHGENIILIDYPSSYNFLIIDPDIKVKNVDCFFSLSRFLYTYIHDTVAKNKYNLFLHFDKKSKPFFRINYKWNKEQKNSYSLVEKKILSLMNNFKNNANSQRIIKSYLLCLLIGIISNNNGNKFTRVNSKKYKINSNSIFIFLHIIKILKKIKI